MRYTTSVQGVDIKLDLDKFCEVFQLRNEGSADFETESELEQEGVRAFYSQIRNDHEDTPAEYEHSICRVSHLSEQWKHCAQIFTRCVDSSGGSLDQINRERWVLLNKLQNAQDFNWG